MTIEEILEKYEPIIYYHIHKLNLWKQFPSYRDDFLQEGRMAVLKAYDRYNEQDNVGAYINTTIRNAIYDYAFKEMKLQHNSKNIQYTDVQYSLPYNEHADSLGFIIKDMIDYDKDSDILRSYFIENKTQKDIANEYGVSQQWISLIVRKFKERVIDET